MTLSFKPRSILQLTISGFLAVTGLLITALVVTADQLDGLSDRSQRVVNEAATAMRASRILIEQTTAMERNIRQYSILGDAGILKVYADRRSTFADAARELDSLRLTAEISGYVESLLANEAHAYESIGTLPQNADIGALYPPMQDIAYAISRDINTWTSGELDSIRQEAEATKNLLTGQTIMLVSAALLLAGIFTVLITRPLLQVNRAINQLGSGAYATPVAIRGPKDLVSLGERLEWLRSRLNQLEQQRSSFLRHVSHELKTPLAAMQESSALLSDGVVGELSDAQKAIIRIQSSSCQRLLRLIEDLLRYNADSFSVLNVMPQPVRLDKLVEDVLNAHELAIASAQLLPETRLARCVVQGDAEQLRVVIDNLVTNAIRFSPSGGKLILSLQQDAAQTVIEVLDQGPGIAPEEVDKIFEAFYQGKVPEKDYYKGSGLGLAIASEYARANGGRIEAISSASGGHFRVLLPPGRQGE
jgi:two-component system sensor histidine kinase GlrK